MSWLRQRARRGEAGFTIVEMVVAASVMAIGIFGTMTVFLGTLRTTSAGEARTRASALAAQEVEAMRSAPYAQVGFSSGQTGFRSTFEGKTTVIVASPVFSPTTTPYTFDGQVFTITRDIVWLSYGSVAQAYKQVTAQITWVDKSGTHVTRQDGGVYPGGLGPASATTSTSTTSTTSPVTPGTAGTVTAAQNSSNPTSAINLSWTGGVPVPTYWEIQYSSNGGSSWVVVTTTQPGATLNYTVTGLSATTTYTLRIRGVIGSQTSNWASATATTATPPSSCLVTNSSVSPSTVQKKSNNTLAVDLTVTVNTNGFCSGLLVKYPADSNPAAVAMTQSGATFTHNLSKTAYTSWSTGAKIIKVTTAAGTQVAAISLTVTN